MDRLSNDEARAQAMRLLVSPDGMRGARVHQLDAPNPLYSGWLDLTDLGDYAFHMVVAGLQMEALSGVRV